ncbi:Hypothetical protein ETEE_2771 [Edwardsiella anguillarum ET080813]|uniref:Uncharacterized protein n=1 Tax=Edwardsiella anguillarum ET080813 TaxID=667120 RepID=A0A076LUF2_9GAMM|nr:Hypothetical protein ETEE_2771 [Edwardsiella anguillarum ET080813]
MNYNNKFRSLGFFYSRYYFQVTYFYLSIISGQYPKASQ